MAIEIKPIVEEVLAGKEVVLTARTRDDVEIERFRTNLVDLEPALRVEVLVKASTNCHSEIEVTLTLVTVTNWMRNSIERALSDTKLPIQRKQHEPA